ncbi:MAG: FKBP-type peptidyl-prolyl cis-trans isomerase [Moraxella sp.]|nr:FKBP-type peptidyl-prolyl cis-trans isomerase [Moraxella sp.]
MKSTKFIATALVAALALAGCNSNTQKPASSAATATINNDSPEVQKVGYAIGFDMGSNIKEMADDMDLDAFQQGLKDAYAGKDSVLTDEQTEAVIMAYQTRKQGEMVEKQKQEAVTNKAAGDAFLAENGKKDGVITTASGLQYKVITEGSGENPKATDTVTVHYEGKLVDGKVFDSSYERGEPAQFPLNAVIPGWTEGLQLMKPGAKYEFYVPADLAYGETGNPSIPPNSTLIFTVELLTEAQAKEAVAKAQAAAEAQMAELMKQMQVQQGADTAPTAQPAEAAK